MASEQQYIELYEQARQMIMDHASEAMNAVRDQAFEDFRRQGFPSRKVERYKYTDIEKLFCTRLWCEPEPSADSRRPLSGIPLRRSQPLDIPVFRGQRYVLS